MKNLYRIFGRFIFRLLLPVMAVFLNRTERTYVAIIYNKKVLLVKNWLDYDNWRLPGGGMHEGEAKSRAATREINEELGILVDESSLMSFEADDVDRNGLKIKCVYWYCILDHTPKIRRQAFEIVDVAWFDSLPMQSNAELASVFRELKNAKLL